MDVDIEAIMAEIENDETEIEPVVKDVVVEETTETTEVVVPDENKALTLDIDEEGALAQRIVENSLSVIDNAKTVFKSFSDDVFHGKDRSTSSKEAMLKALDVQNNANKNMIDMAKVLKDKDSSSTNILINTVSEKQAGISLSNIKGNL